MAQLKKKVDSPKEEKSETPAMPKKRVPAAAPWDSQDAIDPSKGGTPQFRQDGGGMAAEAPAGMSGIGGDPRPAKLRDQMNGKAGQPPSPQELMQILDQAKQNPALMKLLMDALQAPEQGQ